MAEKVEIEVSVQGDGSAAKSVGNIKKELREAQAEALKLSREFGELSPQALEAVKKVTALKDEIGDLNERIALFDPGAKFKAFGNVVTGITGGFAAAQGAMALFGSESEELQKQLVKLQGALALTEGLSTIGDSWKDFQRLGAIVKGQVVSAFTTLRGAIIATGIGALAVGIGLVVANFEAIEKWIKKIIPGFEGFGAAFNKVKAVAMGVLSGIIEQFKVLGEIVVNVFSGEFGAAIDAAKGAGARIGKAYSQGFQEEVESQALEAARKAIAAQVAEDERVLKLAQAFGEKKATQAEAIERKILEQKILLYDKDTEEYKNAVNDRAVFEIKAEQAREARAKEAAKKAEDERKKQQEKIKQEQDIALATLKQAQQLEYQGAVITGKNVYDLKLKHLTEQKDLLQSQGRSTSEVQFQIDSEMLEQRKQLNTALSEGVDTRERKAWAALENTSKAQTNLTNEQIANNERLTQSDLAREAIKQQTELGQQAAMQATADLTTSIAGLVGEQTTAGKALAIASTTINTYQAAMQAYLNGQQIGGPWGIAAGIIAAAAAVATGVANIKRITAVKIPGGKGSGGGAASGVSSVNTAPALPSVQPNTGAMVDQLAEVNSNMRQATRVTVVESDITDTQNRVSVIESNAKF